MDFYDVCKERYSVRSFSDRVVEKDKIERVIEAIRLAPTALNNQPYFIYCIQQANNLEKLIKANAVTYGANTIMVICSNKNNFWKNRYSMQENILQDIGIIGVTALYACTNEGLGSCYVCNFDPNKLKDLLNIDDNLVPECLICIGYKDEKGIPSDRHFLRKATEDIVIYK